MQVLLQIFAGIAQLVEQRIRNAKVGGSTPLTGTQEMRLYRKRFFCAILWRREGGQKKVGNRDLDLLS